MYILNKDAVRLMQFEALRKLIEETIEKVQKGKRRNKLVWHLAWMDQRISFLRDKLGLTNCEVYDD